jgi:hypothetical protein
MARTTTELLLRYLQHANGIGEPAKILIDPHLVLRQSTARLH